MVLDFDTWFQNNNKKKKLQLMKNLDEGPSFSHIPYAKMVA